MFSHIPKNNDPITVKSDYQELEKKILFITYTRIGDAVLSSGILTKLLRDNPKAKITIACGKIAAPLFAAVPNLERIIVMNKKPFHLHWFNLWTNVFSTKWDIIVDLRCSLISYLLFTKKRLRLKKQKEKQHRVIDNATVLGVKESPPSPFIWVAREHRNGAAKRMYKAEKVLAIAPSSNWTAKTWATENFIEIIKRITSENGFLPNASIAVFGSDSEREQIKPILASIPKNKLIDLVGGVGLLSAYACLEKCDFYIGNDSGLMHMSAASGVLTLGLFGPTDEKRYSPWGDRAMAVRTDIPLEKIFPKNFNHRNCGSLMDSLSVDKVEDAAWTLWQKYHRHPERKG